MLRNILGIPLIVLGFGILFITGLWGCYLSWNVIHDVSSILSFIAIVFFPVLFAVTPIYDALANGNWDLIIINYGGILIGGILATIGSAIKG